MSAHDSALGRTTDYPRTYTPDVLFPIARRGAREANGIGADLPFTGVDIWNAWELSWLGPTGRPEVATVEIRVPAESPNIIESKSLKLYLGSLAMSRFEQASDVRDVICRDLSAAAGAAVNVDFDAGTVVDELPGECIDDLDTECDTWTVDPALLQSDPSDIVEESLHTHLLRSLCPVTNQPDIGSLLVRYSGPRIDRRSLLRYVVSFREHDDFHEACVERIFVDVVDRCGAEKLSVYARYQRRGGIDINPYRSNDDSEPGNTRLWRQ